MRVSAFFLAVCAITPLFAASLPIEDEPERLTALQALFPGSAIVFQGGQVLNFSTRTPDKNHLVSIPDGLASERVYTVSGPPRNKLEQCASKTPSDVRPSELREIRLRLYPWPGARADRERLAIVQYAFQRATPDSSCTSVGLLARLTNNDSGWRVEDRFLLDPRGHRSLQSVQFLDLTGDSSETLAVESDSSDEQSQGTSLALFSLAGGRFDLWIDQATRMYATALGEELYTETLDVARTRQNRARQFCFTRTVFAEENKWYPTPHVTHPCYQRGRGILADDADRRKAWLEALPSPR